MASIDQRGDTWRARIRIPGFQLKTRSFDSYEEAKVWADRAEAQLRAGVDSIPDFGLEPTLREALERYAEEVTPEKKSHEQELRRIAAWQQRPVADLKLSKLKARHFKEFKKERSKGGASGNTIRLDLAVISNLFRVAREEWDMPYLQNPISVMRKPKPGKGRDRRLSADEADRFNEALKECRNELIPLAVEFAIHTAARQGEILRLKQGLVDMQARVAIFRDTKNGEDRAIPLSHGALAVLQKVNALNLPGPTVFPLTRNAIVAAWRRILKRAAIDDFRFHDLRHEACTRLFERGLSVMEVQKITGHKTLSQLLRYTHLKVDHLNRRLDETEEQAMSTRSDRGTSAQLTPNALVSRLDETEAKVVRPAVPSRPGVRANKPVEAAESRRPIPDPSPSVASAGGTTWPVNVIPLGPRR
jgi:integrase